MATPLWTEQQMVRSGLLLKYFFQNPARAHQISQLFANEAEYLTVFYEWDVCAGAAFDRMESTFPKQKFRHSRRIFNIE